tara:strand:+ start:411 stop:563 length:153 start_codon:yes stop_codon:yes gene_type:complete
MTVQELIKSLEDLLKEKQISPDQNICTGYFEGKKVIAEYLTTDEDSVFIA